MFRVLYRMHVSTFELMDLNLNNINGHARVMFEWLIQAGSYYKSEVAIVEWYL